MQSALDALISGSSAGAPAAAPSAAPTSALDSLITHSPAPAGTPPPAKTPGNATPPVGEGITPQAPANDSGYGAAAQTDPASGRPLLTYPLKIPATFMSPETTATLVDQTRVAPSFDPTVAQPLTHDQLVNPRMAESMSQSLRAQLGAQAYQELDHVVPLSELGSNLQANLRLENAQNSSKSYNASSNPTPTDPEELKIYDAIRSGSISLLDGWKQLAKLKGITLPEDRAQNNPLNQFLLMHGTLLKTLAGVQGIVEGILHPAAPAGTPQPKPGNVMINVTTTPFANGISNVIPGIGQGTPQPDIIRAATPEEAANMKPISPAETIQNAEAAQEQLGMSPGIPMFTPFGGKTMIPNTAMHQQLKFVVELPERAVNTIADFSAGLLNSAGEVVGAPNEGEALREHMNQERVPSILKSSVGTYDAMRNAGYDTATSIALASLQAGAEGAIDADIVSSVWGASAKAFLPELQGDVEQLAAWKALGKPTTLEEAKAAQRTLAHQFHPDVAGGSTEQMAAINHAYDVLAEKGIPASEQSVIQKIFSKFGKQINDAADVVRGIQKQAGYLPSGEPAAPSALDSLSEANAASAESKVGFSESKSMTEGTSADVAGVREPSGATESTTSLPPLDQAEKSTKNTLSPARMNFEREFSMHPAQEDILPGNPIISKYMGEVNAQEPNHLQATNKIAAELGGKSYARVKAIESLKAKLARRPWAKLADIGDMNGSSVVVPSDKVDAAIELAKANYRITNVDDFRKNPDFLGYHSVHLDVEHPNGMIGELQIHGGDDAFARKEYAHEIYDRWRKYIEVNRQAGTVTEHGIPTDVWDKVPLEKRDEFVKDVFHSRDIFSGKAEVPEKFIKKAEDFETATEARSKELGVAKENMKQSVDAKELDKKKYYVRDVGDNNAGFHEVKGKPVEIEPGLDTFVHRSLHEKEWHVSEGRSGAFIGKGKTQAQAIENARAMLKSHAGEVQEAIENRVADYGLSPRYEGESPTAGKSMDEVASKLNKANEAYQEMQARRGATTLASGVNPGLDKFLREDVKPTLQGLGEGFVKAMKEITHIVAPRVGANPKALDLMYEAFGGRNKAEFIIEKTLEKIEKSFDKMPREAQIDFVDRVKRGLPQESPELQAVADMLRKIDTETYAEVQKLKPSAVYKDNHYRVLWKKIPGAPERKGFAGLFRRPLEGSKGFLKKATLVDMSEGIAKGGEPYSYNPITMARRAYADQMKFITARKMIETAKEQGLAKFVKMGQPTPEGFGRIDDKIARVYLPVETTAPFEGRAITQRGEWVFEKSFARLINNHLSRDWVRTTAIGNSLMAIKNATTAIELSLSAFHAVFETIETASSQMGLGIRKIVNMGVRGDMRMLRAGIKDILTSPGAPVSTAKLGSEAKKFLAAKYVENPSPALAAAAQSFAKKFPDAAHLLDDLFLGGGKLAIHQDYQIDTAKTFMENLTNQNYIGAALRALPAANAELYKPLFEKYIPNLKIGMFLNEYSYTLMERESDLAAGKVTRAQLARQVWDFVENRLGEMNFQSLFWNNTFKSTMQLFFRSVTWKLGNIRAFMGGSVSQVREVVDAIRAGRVPRMTQETAWAFSLALMTATMATIIMKAMTGKNPQNVKDLVYPQIDPNDETKRLSMPTYMRDLVSLQHAPAGYVQSSMSSEIGRLMDVWQNRDFYGTEIYNPSDPYSTKALDVTLHMVPLPFSISNLTKANESGGAKAAGFLGFTQAPAYIRQSGIQQQIFSLYDARFGGGTQTQAQAAAQNFKTQIRQAYYAGDLVTANQMIQQAVDKGYLTPSGVATFIKDADKPGDVRAFARFDAADQETLYRNMSLDDLKIYGFEAKPAVRSIMSTLSPAARQFVDGVQNGSIKPPQWKAGRIVTP